MKQLSLDLDLVPIKLSKVENAERIEELARQLLDVFDDWRESLPRHENSKHYSKPIPNKENNAHV